MRTNVLTKTQINELFIYSEGNLYWRKSPSNSVDTKKPAGSLKSDGTGYVRVTYKRKQYQLHNLIWVLHNGYILDSFYVDHIDNDPSNNRIENLQLLTLTENLRKRVRVSSPKGGVYFRRERRNPWQAKINYKGKAIHIGSFSTEQEAYEALATWKAINISST